MNEYEGIEIPVEDVVEGDYIDDGIEQDYESDYYESDYESDELDEDLDDDIDEEPSDDDIEYVEMPSYVPDEFIPPDEFESESDELEFYRNNYARAFELHQTDEFKQDLLRAYDNELLKREQEVDKLVAIKEALNGDPTKAFKMYFPQGLKQFGHSPEFTLQEIDTYVDAKMAEEFGDNYRDAFMQEDLLRPSSLSSQMMRRKQELEGEYTEHNSNVQNMQVSQPQVSQEEMNAYIDNEYERHFNDIPREDYNSFVDTIRDWKPSMADIYRAYNHEEYVLTAYQKGLEEGKRNIIREINNAGARPLEHKRDKDDSNYFDAPDERSMFRKLAINKHY